MEEVEPRREQRPKKKDAAANGGGTEAGGLGARYRSPSIISPKRAISYRVGDVRGAGAAGASEGWQEVSGVLFVHSRRGLDEIVNLHIVRLAARGFVVYAQIRSTPGFDTKMPIEHDYALEDDLSAGLDAS